MECVWERLNMRISVWVTVSMPRLHLAVALLGFDVGATLALQAEQQVVLGIINTYVGVIDKGCVGEGSCTTDAHASSSFGGFGLQHALTGQLSATAHAVEQWPNAAMGQVATHKNVVSLCVVRAASVQLV